MWADRNTLRLAADRNWIMNRQFDPFVRLGRSMWADRNVTIRPAVGHRVISGDKPSMWADRNKVSLAAQHYWLRWRGSNKWEPTTMAEHFTYRVSWSAADGEHVGTCLEFPGLSHLASDPAEALDGVRKLVADVVADMQASNEPIPDGDAAARAEFDRILTRLEDEIPKLSARLDALLAASKARAYPPVERELTEAEIRADERKRIAAFVADFSWVLALSGDPNAFTPMDKALNEAADDAACSVCDQIADAILKLT